VSIAQVECGEQKQGGQVIDQRQHDHPSAGRNTTAFGDFADAEQDNAQFLVEQTNDAQQQQHRQHAIQPIRQPRAEDE
jgi:hypothetical protein